MLELGGAVRVRLGRTDPAGRADAFARAVVALLYGSGGKKQNQDDNGDDVTSVVAAPKKKGESKHGKKARLGRNEYRDAMQE